MLKTLINIPNLIFMSFGIILKQVHITFWREEHQKVLTLLRSSPEMFRLQPIPPFILPEQSL